MPLVERRVLLHKASVSRARWSKDGKYVVTCGHDKALRLWNPFRVAENVLHENSAPAPVEHGLQIKEYSGPHGHEVADVAIAKDNASFASCGGDRTVFVWDVTNGIVLRRLEGHSQRVNSVAFNTDDSILASASYDQTVTTHQPVLSLTTPYNDHTTVEKVCPLAQHNLSWAGSPLGHALKRKRTSADNF